MPPPGSGVLTAYIMNILDGQLTGQRAGVKSSRDPQIYHRIAEAFKHAYAQRTKLADPRFVTEVLEVRILVTRRRYTRDESILDFYIE